MTNDERSAAVASATVRVQRAIRLATAALTGETVRKATSTEKLKAILREAGPTWSSR